MTITVNVKILDDIMEGSLNWPITAEFSS